MTCDLCSLRSLEDHLCAMEGHMTPVLLLNERVFSPQDATVVMGPQAVSAVHSSHCSAGLLQTVFAEYLHSRVTASLRHPAAATNGLSAPLQTFF